MFESNGFYEILLLPSSVNLKAFTPIFHNRLINNHLIKWHIDLHSRSSLTLFRHIKSNFDISEYLLKVTIPTYHSVIANYVYHFKVFLLCSYVSNL